MQALNDLDVTSRSDRGYSYHNDSNKGEICQTESPLIRGLTPEKISNSRRLSG